MLGIISTVALVLCASDPWHQQPFTLPPESTIKRQLQLRIGPQLLHVVHDAAAGEQAAAAICKAPSPVHAQLLQQLMENPAALTGSVQVWRDQLFIDGMTFPCDENLLELTGSMCGEAYGTYTGAVGSLRGRTDVRAEGADDDDNQAHRIFYCDGEQYELLGEEDSKTGFMMAYFQATVYEILLNMLSLALGKEARLKGIGEKRKKTGRFRDAMEIAGEMSNTLSIAWRTMIIVHLFYRFFVNFRHGEKYVCYVLGLTSFRGFWLFGTFLMSLVYLKFRHSPITIGEFLRGAVPRELDPEYTPEVAEDKMAQWCAFFFRLNVKLDLIAAVATYIIFLVSLPVLLLMLATSLTTVILFLPLFIWVVLQLLPFVIGFLLLLSIIGRLLGVREALKLIAALVKVGADLKNVMMHSAVGVLLLVTFPATVWYYFGFLAITDAYNKLPTNIFMRIVNADPKIVMTLKLRTAFDITMPRVGTMFIIRLLNCVPFLFKNLTEGLETVFPALAKAAETAATSTDVAASSVTAATATSVEGTAATDGAGDVAMQTAA